MFRRTCIVTCGPTATEMVAGLWVLSLLSMAVAAAAETPYTTEAEQLYRQLRRADDRAAQRLGRRWYGLVQLQDWTDDTGQFTVSAKYLEHDPDLKWVKLRAERTIDGRRQVKDLTVPVERLSKVCQSRVRQIAFLESRVREAAAGVLQEEEADDDQLPGAAGEIPGEEPLGGDGRPPSRPAEPSFPEEPVADQAANAPRLLDNQPWRTSYGAFRSSFNVARGGDGEPRVNWGPLQPLQQVHDLTQQLTENGSLSPQMMLGLAMQLNAIGDFVWDTTLTRPVTDDSAWHERLDLPALPDPLALELVLDGDGGSWQNLEVGDRVQIVGRFVAFGGEYKIVAAIRFLDNP